MALAQGAASEGEAEEAGESFVALVQEELEHPFSHDIRRDSGTSSVGKVTFNFVNAVVGSGVLAIPYALQQAGLVTGLAMAAFVGLSTDVTVRQLVNTGLREDVRNYEELMDKLFGFPGWATISLLMFLYDFGAMLSYLIILGDVSTSVVQEFCAQVLGVSGGLLDDRWALRRVCILSIALCLMLPLCLLRDISKLEKASTFSVVTIVLVVLVIVTAAASGDNCPQREQHPDSCPDLSQPWATVVGPSPGTAFGIFAFGFVCHDTAFMFFNSLRAPTQARWKRVTRLSLGASVSICLLLAVPAYLAFRDQISQNILKNFAGGDGKIIIVRVLFLLTVSFTYPICFFICRHILNELIYRWQHRHQDRPPGTPAGLSIKQVPQSRHVALTLSLFASTLVIVSFVDQLGLVMSLTGNISAVSIAFILPPLCAIKSKWRANVLAAQDETADLDAPLLGPSSGGWAGAVSAGWEPSFLGQFAVLAFGAFTLVFATAQGSMLDELRTLQLETGRSLLSEASALQCVMAEPCMSNGCLGALPVVTGETCLPVLSNFSTTVTADASNGDSMGAVALMLDAPLDDALAAGVCTSFANDTIGATCFMQTPFQATMQSMENNRDGSCANFNTEIVALLMGDDNSTSSESSSPAFTPTGNSSAAQDAIIDAAVAGVIESSMGAETATAVSSAFNALGLTWEMFIGSALGFIPKADPAVVMSNMGASCLADHLNATGASADAWAATLLGSALAETVSLANASEVSGWIITQYNGTERLTNLTAETNATYATAVVLGELAEAHPGAAAVLSFGVSLDTCFTSHLTTIDFFLTLFGKAAADQALAEDESAFMTGAFLSSACALGTSTVSGAQDNVNPSDVNKAACYQLAIMSHAPELMIGAAEGTIGIDDLLSLKDSSATIKSRCDAVSVDIGTLPAYSYTAPTNAPVTAPTEGEGVINGAISGSPALALAVASLALAMQRLDDEMLRTKALAVERLLGRAVDKVVASPAGDTGYRMKVNFRLWWPSVPTPGVRKVPRYAFENPDTNKLELVSQFPIADKLINDSMPLVEEGWTKHESLSRGAFSVRFHTATTKELVVSIMYKRPPLSSAAWEEAAEDLREMIMANTNATKVSVLGRARKLLLCVGRTWVEEAFELEHNGKPVTFRYQQGSESFSQPNGLINREMIQWALDSTVNTQNLVSNDLLELYCGNGNFTAPLAKFNYDFTLASEVGRLSVQEALWTMAANDVPRTSVVRMSSEEMAQAFFGTRRFQRLREINLNDYDFRTIFVDPPRQGLDRGSLTLLSHHAGDAVYFSCNPITLRRDLNELRESSPHNLEIDELVCFDQFPQTPHLECAVKLRMLS
ncbi:tRNA/tmRNA (uracil-C(5))-methyltransferase (tRNA (uracil(54)-C(5))-methyltransferase) (tRNA(m5U54)-methyltransferase) (RUMT) (tmRNA (uracil(341)-C(5))-methyltransferase) [Durusdinium trenchii]|uniref:tRNA/tmRNA (Uracil-C(5))-methyltransferase (tRNA (uracil(54)-C(5))-methyltransferase) (tRNA(m5U54)-methyltransferase) (RUMT) (tmRNA (uracil(341)-C(5))-methyltransferase) n=1 Tax=Durusdinium trenchii TaxID=1381693 RepID=A0ABP0RLC5_9DINO